MIARNILSRPVVAPFRLPGAVPAPRAEALLLAPLQPVLGRIVRRIAARHPEIFARLDPHHRADYLIVPRELPFALHLRPDPAAPILRAVSRRTPPPHHARIEGGFARLLQMIDGTCDGDAAFFARDLVIDGNVEAVVSLRNALDDLDGSIVQETADLFGPPGRVGLDLLRRWSAGR